MSQLDEVVFFIDETLDSMASRPGLWGMGVTLQVIRLLEVRSICFGADKNVLQRYRVWKNSDGAVLNISPSGLSEFIAEERARQDG